MEHTLVGSDDSLLYTEFLDATRIFQRVFDRWALPLAADAHFFGEDPQGDLIRRKGDDVGRRCRLGRREK
jgi:hypothetical protein